MIEIYKGKDKGKQKWRWRAVKNGAVIARSEEPFALPRNAERSIQTLDRILVDDEDRQDFYFGRDSKIYWRVMSKNGRILAISPTGYDSSKEARAMFNVAKKAIDISKITELK